MKNAINRTLRVFTATLLLAVGAHAAAASPSPATVWDWQFATAATPADATLSGGAGTAQATIALGDFASGWMASNSVLGSAQGIWDLGRNGTITLSGSAAFAGTAGQSALLTVKVVQYRDGTIYNQLAHVSVPGAGFLSFDTSSAGATSLGEWVVDTTQWQVPADGVVNSVSVTSAYYGSLVDRVTIETPAPVTAPPQLSIQRVGPDNQQVQISWPASFAGMVLESNVNPANSAGWTAVAATVQVSGSVRSVTLDAVGAAQFYRLRQP